MRNTLRATLATNLGRKDVDSVYLVNLNVVMCISSYHCLSGRDLLRNYLRLIWLIFKQFDLFFLNPLSRYFISNGTNRSLGCMSNTLALIPPSLCIVMLLHDFYRCCILTSWLHHGYGYDMFRLWVVSHHLMHGFLAIWGWQIILLAWAPSAIWRSRIVRGLSVVSVRKLPHIRVLSLILIDILFGFFFDTFSVCFNDLAWFQNSY